MAFNRLIVPKIVARLSASCTLATVAGLVAAVYVTAPLNWHTAGYAAARATPAPVASPPMTRAFQLVRARAVPVSDVVIKEGSGELELLASRRTKKQDETGEAVPKSEWDGTPAHLSKDGQPAALAAPEKAGKKEVTKDEQPAVGKKVEPAPKLVPPAKSDSQPGAATATPAAETIPPVKEAWTPEEIAAALKDCIKLLGPVAAEIEPIDATKHQQCGAPAPILLKSIGDKDRLEFSPPVEINCKLAVALADWVDRTLQPAAKELLNSRVVRISNASGYSCRNVYGLPNAQLSQHALANAVDVPSFVLADGRTIKVKGGWGDTARDLKAKAEAVAAAEKAASTGTKTADAAKNDSKTSDKDSSKDTATERQATKKLGKDKPEVAAADPAAKGAEKSTDVKKQKLASL